MIHIQFQSIFCFEKNLKRSPLWLSSRGRGLSEGAILIAISQYLEADIVERISHF